VKNADAQREGITAHERRAQVIAQLHKQAISAGNDQASRSEAKIAEIVRVMRQRRVKGWRFVAAMTVFALMRPGANVGWHSLAGHPRRRRFAGIFIDRRGRADTPNPSHPNTVDRGSNSIPRTSAGEVAAQLRPRREACRQPGRR
jgi:hypothetical protein